MLSKVKSLYVPLRASCQLASKRGMMIPNSRFGLTQKTFNVPQYSFASEETSKIEKNENNGNENKEQQQEQEEVRVSFVEYMQTEPNPSEMNYIYNSKTIYELKMTKDQIKNGKQAYWGMTAFWSAASYLTFNFLNPWFTLVPGVLLAGSLFTLKGSYSFAKQLVQKIELIDLYHVKLYPMNMDGKDIICNIQDTEIIGVNLLSSSKGEDGTPQNSYAVIANFTNTVGGSQHFLMRLIIDPKTTTVDNMDLLKCILYGDVNQIPNFRLLVNTVDLSETDTKQIEEKESVQSTI